MKATSDITLLGVQPPVGQYNWGQSNDLLSVNFPVDFENVLLTKSKVRSYIKVKPPHASKYCFMNFCTHFPAICNA